MARGGLEQDGGSRVEAVLFDVDFTLAKPGPLNDEEWDLMHQHTVIGERILLAAPALRPVAELVRASHERWDGTGYPDGLAADAISLGARIFAVADSFDAMTSDRPYRGSIGVEPALAELRGGSGSQFDPEVVRVFVDMIETDPPDDEPFLHALKHAS